jgi:hypothetical protein
MLKYKISWKSVQWGPDCSVRTDWRKDLTKSVVSFRNFAKAPKNSRVYIHDDAEGAVKGGKSTGIKADHPSTFGAEVQNVWSCTFFCPHASTARTCLRTDTAVSVLHFIFCLCSQFLWRCILLSLSAINSSATEIRWIRGEQSYVTKTNSKLLLLFLN